jgi:hypothetical protein
VGRVWASDPASPVHIWLRVCLAKNTLMRFSRVLFLSILIYGQASLFSISENFKNMWGSSLIYLRAPHALFFFLFDMLLFRQNQQCSLLQVGCLRSDSIFPFA